MDNTLISVIRSEVAIFLGALMAAIGFQLLTGRIRTTGLLASDGASISTSRVQLLIFTLGAAGWLLLQVMKQPDAFPTLPTEMVLALTGSQGIYLGFKLNDLLSRIRASRLN